MDVTATPQTQVLPIFSDDSPTLPNDPINLSNNQNSRDAITAVLPNSRSPSPTAMEHTGLASTNSAPLTMAPPTEENRKVCQNLLFCQEQISEAIKGNHELKQQVINDEVPLTAGQQAIHSKLYQINERTIYAHKIEAERLGKCPIPTCSIHYPVPINLNVIPNNPNDKRKHTNEATDSSTDEDGFQKPRRKLVARNTVQSPAPSTSTANHYEPLSNIDTTDKTDPSTNTTPPREKVPSVFVPIKTDIMSICAQIEALTVNETKPTFKVQGDNLKVSFASIEEYRKITKIMTEKDIEYVIITLRNSRPIKVCIKGLPRNFDIETIKNELLERDFKVQDVSQLRSFRDKAPLPIFLVTLSQSPNVDQIYNITRMFYVTVQVVKYERTGRVNQCFRCQGFYHGSSQCAMKPKCVKCGQSHESKLCKKLPETTPTCANCNGAHPASYRGCKMFPKWTRPSTSYKNPAHTRFPSEPTAPNRNPRNFNWSRPVINQNQVENNEFPDLNSTSQPPTQNPWVNHKHSAPANSDQKTISDLLKLITNLTSRIDKMQATIDNLMTQLASKTE